MRHLLNLLLLVSFTTTTATAVALQSVSSIAATAAVELQRRAPTLPQTPLASSLVNAEMQSPQSEQTCSPIYTI